MNSRSWLIFGLGVCASLAACGDDATADHRSGSNSPVLANILDSGALTGADAGVHAVDAGVNAGDAAAHAVDAGAHGLEAGAGSADAGFSANPPVTSTPSAADVKLGTDAVAKLKQCALYEPPANPADDLIEDEYDRCAARCILSASCAVLKELMCSVVVPVTNAALLCAAKCPEHPSDGFVCADGTRVPYAATCDGLSDCRGGADEANCASYACANGEIVAFTDARCDGIADCADGTDEAGCVVICN